jgi:hypothetical protein
MKSSVAEQMMELNNIAIPIYKCGYCNKEYKLKQNYDRHSISCELYYKTNSEKKEDKEKVPTVKELYGIILDMSVKYSKLEKKVEELTKWNAAKKKKLNIIEWLNEKYPNDNNNSNNSKSNTFSKWLNTIQISRIHLEKVFKSDYINSIVEIIHELSDDIIKAFDQKENVFFIYDTNNENEEVNIKKENSWKVMSSQIFIHLINLINKKLLNEFVNWQKKNKYRMYEDEFSSIYTANIKKITCMHLSQEQIQNKIKKDLYKTIKMNLQNIVEYEFSF